MSKLWHVEIELLFRENYHKYKRSLLFLETLQKKQWQLKFSQPLEFLNPTSLLPTQPDCKQCLRPPPTAPCHVQRARIWTNTDPWWWTIHLLGHHRRWSKLSTIFFISSPSSGHDKWRNHLQSTHHVTNKQSIVVVHPYIKPYKVNLKIWNFEVREPLRPIQVYLDWIRLRLIRYETCSIPSVCFSIWYRCRLPILIFSGGGYVAEIGAHAQGHP